MTVENPPPFMSQLWDLVPTMMVLIGLFVAVWWLQRSFEQGESKVAVRTALGPMGLESAVGCLVLMWILHPSSVGPAPAKPTCIAPVYHLQLCHEA